MKFKLKKLISPSIFIFLSALIVRIIYILWYYKFSSGSFRQYIPLSDQKTYDSIAKNFLDGFGINWLGIFKAVYPPLYPLFLSFIYFLTGNSYYSYFAVFFVQAVLISLTCSLIYLIAKKLFDKLTAFLAAIIICLYQPFIVVVADLCPENLIIFVSVSYIYLLTGIAGDSRSKRLFFLGITSGIAILIKPIFLTLLPVITILWFIFFIKGYYQKIVFIIIGCLLSLMPWLVRNYYQFHSLVISTQSGPIFFVTTNPKYFTYTRIGGREAIWKYIKYPENIRNDLLVKDSINFIKKNFRAYFLKSVKNYTGLFDPKSKVVFLLLFLTGLGGVLAFLKKRKSALILLIFLFLFYSQYALIFTYPRFRYPLDWVLILFISYTIIFFIRKIGFKSGFLNSYLDANTGFLIKKIILILGYPLIFLLLVFSVFMATKYTKPLKPLNSLDNIIRYQKDNNASIGPYINKMVTCIGIIRYINRNSYYPKGNAKNSELNNSSEFKDFFDIYIVPSGQFDTFDLVINNRGEYITVNYNGHIGFDIKNGTLVKIRGKIIGQNFLGQIYLAGENLSKL